MNKREAEGLVEGVLPQPYSEADFRRLVVNIFPDMEPKSDRWTGAYVPEAFRSGVAQYSRLGKVEDAEGYTVDVLAVKLKNAGTLERARTLQRNFVARYLNGGRGDALRDAALVAFYADGSPDWRFSLVRMDYALDPEKNKIRKELTPARRYSFLVGQGEKTHTARKQLATLLQGGAQPTLEELEKAFNIESVTKEFFEKYKTLFLNLKEELDGLEQRDPRIRQEFAAKNIDTATFAKRLLGQVVFLYFLQKKGWLGVGRNVDGSLEPWGTGPKDFLRRLFNKQVVPYENFFDDLLEPLFYEALANDRGAESYYSRFACRIPFLNGGLFEPVGGYNWAETRINLRNETFAQIFDTFDLYNFTVREDEPLDKEVAVDPEMLGKVFENLLEVRDRKSKGAFYTPREIVHYMCQESLINYLDTALNTVTRPLLKPAPSQAELFGRPQTRQEPLTEEVYEERVPRADIAEFIRLGDTVQEHDAATAARVKETDAYSFKVPESVRQHAAALDKALADIKICDPAIGSGAFPVGMMNEIVRARGALNAYLGQVNATGRSHLNEARTPYDFKRHAIQESIYGVDIEESAVDIAKLRLWLSLVVDEDDYGTIKPLPNLEYKIVVGNSLLGVEETLFNNELFEKLEKLKGQYFSETRPQEKGRLKGEITALIQELTRGEVDFDFKVYFSEVFQEKGGFDVVIGNPPYGLVNKKQNKTDGISATEEEIAYYKSSQEYLPAKGRMLNIFRLFIVRSTTILRRRGFFTQIFPLAFAGDESAGRLRAYLLKNTSFQGLEAFPERDNEKKRVFEAVKMSVCILNLVKLVTDSNHFFLRIHKDKFVDERNAKVQLSDKDIALIDSANFTIPLLGSADLALLKKVYKQSLRISNIGHCYTGEIDMTLDRRYISNDSSDAVMIKGAILGRYIIRKKMSQGEVEYLKASLYRSTSKGEKARHHQARRIVMQGITGVNEARRLKMTMADSGVFCANSVNYVVFTDTKFRHEFVLGLLNSSLLNFVFAKSSTNSNVNGYEVDNLPVKNLSLSDSTDKAMHDRMVALVSRMLFLHEEKGQGEGARPVAEIDAEIRATDAEIDALVYRLYGLTEEEIRIVEGSGVR